MRRAIVSPKKAAPRKIAASATSVSVIMIFDFVAAASFLAATKKAATLS